MKYKIVTLRDRAADVFGQPTFVANVGSAIRSFGDEVRRNAPDNALFNHPEDFDLYEIGVYDDATASFEQCMPKQIAVGKDYKA